MKDKNTSVIMIEFNELCPSLMEQFILAGELPNFSRFYQEAEIFTTDAEEEGENLNPWIQWVTVYSGLTVEEHKVTTLSQGHELKQKVVWDILSDSGYGVWICGSMNSRYDRPLNGYLLPDPWSTGVEPYPPGEFEPYMNFVRAAVQEHTDKSRGINGGKRDFLAYMVTHGMSFQTLSRTSLQLLSERLKGTRWRRAIILEQFQWDLFQWYYRKSYPNFATFFLNSTAHFQHCYWRDMDPKVFRYNPTPQKHSELQNAILYGYQKMDQLLGRLMQLAGRDSQLVLCTALSQQPYLDYEMKGGRHYYRLRDQKNLIEYLGITDPFSYEPVMAEQFYLRFDSEEAVRRAEVVLGSYHIKDRRVFDDERTRLFNIVSFGNKIRLQCRCAADVPSDVTICSQSAAKVAKFYDIFYQLDTIKSGRHHPDGLLWIRRLSRSHVVHKGKVSIRSIAPTLLTMFNVPIPDYMREPVLFS